LDELGAGTILRKVLHWHGYPEYLLERRITILVTTHHPELKAYAHATPVLLMLR